MLPLSGIRVLDLTQQLPGQYCTMILGDFGAEVIKIEEPGKGDATRHIGPFIQGLSCRHLIVNRNKKSLTVNLKDDKGKAIFYRLIRRADVVLESFRPGVMQRLGIDYQTANKYNPGIVYCSMTGYGQDGPYRLVPGHELNYVSMSGILDNTGNEDTGPVIPGVQAADLGAGALMALAGILLALQARNQSGSGQYIDISIFDGLVSWALPTFAVNAVAGQQNPPRGQLNLTGGLGRYQVYQTRDEKYVAVGALEQKFWENLCHGLGCPELIPRGNVLCGEQQQELKEILAARFKSKSRDEWVRDLFHRDCCLTPVQSPAELITDPQMLQRQMLQERESAKAKSTVRQMGFPIKLSETPGSIRLEAPVLGEHTTEILKELGYEEDEIISFRQGGAV